MVARKELAGFRAQIEAYLVGRLLPFWLDHGMDTLHGGFITHFDRHGNDTGEDEKSLIAQSRLLYAFSTALRSGYCDRCRGHAEHAFKFLVEKMWDPVNEGFFWTVNRAGEPAIPDKILYGHSFAVYALSEYTLATGQPEGRQYAERVFDLIQKHCTDTMYGGYFEMFDRRWKLAGPGSKGGDRKTLDVHMHLMEAFTTLYECTKRELHRRKLLEDIAILTGRLLHPAHATGIPQFTTDWRPAPQIKFDIVWGWDRFKADGEKANALDNTSYGHNLELAWLLRHALEVLEIGAEDYLPIIKRMVDHAVRWGIDYERGGVYVEGRHEGPATDLEKEFWQQCEAMIGTLDAYLLISEPHYLDAYEAVHRFVFSKGINPETGELWPLLTRDGEPIWTHTSHSWKINYHSVRAMIQSLERLDQILAVMKG